MKRIVLYLLMPAFTCLGYSRIITWDASSGLLPCDNSIGQESRFVLSGDTSWLSFQDAAMNVNDDSSIDQLNLKNITTVPLRLDSDWSFQIELRMNSHARPVFDFGATSGMTVQDKRTFLVIASDKVGFAGDKEYLNNQTYAMDTTNCFHVYRVTKASDMVSLYVDDFDIPVMSLSYVLFPVFENHGTSVDLTQTSNPGIANYDIKRFAYNPDGMTIPEPATLSVVAIGGLLLRKRKA